MRDEITTTAGFAQVEIGELAKLGLASAQYNAFRTFELEKIVVSEIFEELEQQYNQSPELTKYAARPMRAAARAVAREFCRDHTAVPRLLQEERGGPTMQELLEQCKDAAGRSPWDGRWSGLTAAQSSRRRKLH